jgi:hypothetical protein
VLLSSAKKRHFKLNQPHLGGWCSLSADSETANTVAGRYLHVTRLVPERGPAFKALQSPTTEIVLRADVCANIEKFSSFYRVGPLKTNRMTGNNESKAGPMRKIFNCSRKTNRPQLQYEWYLIFIPTTHTNRPTNPRNTADEVPSQTVPNLAAHPCIPASQRNRPNKHTLIINRSQTKHPMPNRRIVTANKQPQCIS